MNAALITLGCTLFLMTGEAPVQGTHSMPAPVGVQPGLRMCRPWQQAV